MRMETEVERFLRGFGGIEMKISIIRCWEVVKRSGTRGVNVQPEKKEPVWFGFFHLIYSFWWRQIHTLLEVLKPSILPTRSLLG